MEFLLLLAQADEGLARFLPRILVCKQTGEGGGGGGGIWHATRKGRGS